MTDPEALSGIWEAPDGHGGAVGLHLMLDTTIPAQAPTLGRTPQSWQQLIVNVYERAGQDVAVGEGNGFSDSSRGGGARYENGHLTLHWTDADLDLRRAPGDTWVGRFHRFRFDKQVTLRRPQMNAPLAHAWYLGVWEQGDRTLQTCLHIGRQLSGGITGWSDSLTELGCMRYGPKVQRPATAVERYGLLLNARVLPDDRIEVVLNPTGWCCPHPFVARRGPNGTVHADWPAGPEQVAGTSTWTRVPGDRCLAPASPLAAQTASPCGSCLHGGKGRRPELGGITCGSGAASGHGG